MSEPPAKVDAASNKPVVKPRREFRHPVLQMMGISRLRVPSRNWLIFWSVTGTLVAGYYWDRYERKKIRNYWVDRVAHLGDRSIGPYDVARKVTVYIAPPPNDYIDASLQHFRNFIKPVLTSAAVDHELVFEEKQGYIRSKVAEQIRQIRQKKIDSGDELDQKIESQWNRNLTGGTIIVGRGAYKEYMSGLQEGWLGPLERPKFVQDELDKLAEEEKERLRKRAEANAPAVDGESQMDYDNQFEYEEDRKATMDRKWPVVPAYMPLSELAEQELPAEFAAHSPKPISVFRLPHLLGFLMTPVRIYRWLNQRYLAEEMGSQAAGVVFAATRQYLPEDVNLSVTDEDDWPNRFKQTGFDNNSEWMREFMVDKRIANSMEVYLTAIRDQVAESSTAAELPTQDSSNQHVTIDELKETVRD